MEIRSNCRICRSENHAGIPRIPLESQLLSADSPLVGGVLDPRRHLSMQLLCGFDIRRMWDGFHSGKQPVQGGYQFPKRGFGAGLLVPLGNPTANAVKYYATVDVAAFSEDRDRLDQATAIIYSRNRSKFEAQKIRSPESLDDVNG